MNISYNEKINELPYIFKDSHLLDKKTDPKNLQFGSKIDKNSNNREKYYSVKDIISTEILILNNGLKIRLLGIKEDETQNSSAREFIQKKVRGQKVYLKFDEIKYDPDNNLLCYLYLKNKTFMNAHLIKYGFAKADRKINYKYKSRFIELEQANVLRMESRKCIKRTKEL